MHNNLQFNPTQESNGRINFLDLIIIRRPSHLENDIYQKPITTETTIHFTSIHPTEHKLAAYRYYIERTLTLPLNAECQKREWSTILQIVQHNSFPPTIMQKLRHQIKHKTSHQTHATKRHKCTLTLNPPSLQNRTTDVIIQQHSRKLMMMDKLMSETC